MYCSEHAVTSKHYLILCVCSFTAGILVYVKCPECFRAVKYASAVLFASLIIAAFVCMSLKKRSVRLKPFLLPAFLMLFLFLGIFRCESFDNARSSLGKVDGSSAWLSGRVVSSPAVSSSGMFSRFIVNVRTVETDNSVVKANDDIMLFVPAYAADSISLNDTVTFWGSVTSVNSAASEISPEYARFLKGKNVMFTAKTNHLSPYASPSYSSGIHDAVRRIGIAVHLKVLAACDAMFSENPNINSLIKGMLIGDKADFSDELSDSMSNAGISHITAVSGMHMSVLFSAVTYLLSVSGLGRKHSLLLSVPIIVLFAAAAAFTPSVTRSALMLLVMIFSSLFGQRYSSLTALFFALGIIIFKTPYALFSASLLLSFGAAFGILVFCKYFSEIFGYPHIKLPIYGFITEALAVSLSSFLGTAFFSAFFFNKVSFMQFVTNLWIIPTMTFAFCAGYISCIMYFVIPALSLYVLRYFTAGACQIIYRTAVLFGTGIGNVYAPVKYFGTPLCAIYSLFLFLLYLVLKLFYDRLHSKADTAAKE